MKISGSIPLLVLILTLGSCKQAPIAKSSEAGGNSEVSKTAELGSPAAEPEDGKLPNQVAFLALPKKAREAFISHLGDANRLFGERAIHEAMAELDLASSIFEESPEVHNLRGTCCVEQRKFSDALESFKKASELSKRNPSIQFNIGEVYFVTGDWQQSFDVFTEVREFLPPENRALKRLTDFKLLLCLKKLGHDAEMLAIAKKHDAKIDTPFKWYANAAIAYDDGDVERYQALLSSAFDKFAPAALAPWNDTLVEYDSISRRKRK